MKYECDITAENWISVNDAISRLNTRLAAGEGPDVPAVPDCLVPGRSAAEK